MKSIHRFLFPAFLVLIDFCPLPAQNKDNCTEPSVALYDCNTSSAVTTNDSQKDAINSASKQILLAILSDSSSRQLHLFSYGFADTIENDVAFQGSMFTLPDTGGVRDADYVISSKITGNPGSYDLTVTIMDGHTFARVADGTALFSSATIEEVKDASGSAVRQILPLISNIRRYQAWQKSTNPLLAINPKIEISPAKTKLPLKGSTEVTITAVDCDGVPLAGRQLKLGSKGGSFASPTVQTDAAGKAKVVFNAGASEGMAILTATIPNLISVTHDTIYSNGSASIVVGNIDTENLWVLEFNMNRSWTSYKDEMTKVTDGTAWVQKNSYWRQSAFGKILGTADKKKTRFEFIDTTMSVYGDYFAHDLSKYTGPNPSGGNCPEKYWEMSGSSQTSAAEADSDTKGTASLEYDPQGMMVFVIRVPYTNISSYSYRWYLAGRWENNGCRTYSGHDHGRAKLKLDAPAGISINGMSPVKGLAIFPSYTGNVITGYTISVNITRTGRAPGNEIFVSMDRCTATLKPFSTVNKDK